MRKYNGVKLYLMFCSVQNRSHRGCGKTQPTASDNLKSHKKLPQIPITEVLKNYLSNT